MFAPGDLRSTQRFQSRGGDEAGVTDRAQWRQEGGIPSSWHGAGLAGPLGKNFIVDGTSAMPLRRALPRMIHRRSRNSSPACAEADGVTDVAARVMAGSQEHRRGHRQCGRRRKVLRDRPDLVVITAAFRAGAPGRGLGRTCRTRRSVSSSRRGAPNMRPSSAIGAAGYAVAERAHQPTRQTEPTTGQAEAIVRQGMEAGVLAVKRRAGQLFGDEDVATSLYIDRAKVLDRALKELQRDKTVFAVLSKEQTTIEAAGNKLAAGSTRSEPQPMPQALPGSPGPRLPQGADLRRPQRRRWRARSDASPEQPSETSSPSPATCETGDLARLAAWRRARPDACWRSRRKRVVERAPSE